MKWLVFVLLLVGCGSNPVKSEIVTVEKAVTVKCVKDLPEKPYIHSDDEIRAMTDYAAVLTLIKDRLALMAHAKKLEAVLEACK